MTDKIDERSLAELAESMGIDLDDWSKDAIQMLPSHIGHVCERLAQAKALTSLTDTAYRRFRAMTMLATIDGDPKLAEWKVKARVESEPDFLRHKSTIAKAISFQERLWGLLEALKAKKDIFQSNNAMDRTMAEKG